ncbi:Peroxidase P7 [Bienertia sinuspersici]
MVYATRNIASSDGKLRCPCIKCVNNKLSSPNDVNYHLLQFGMMHNYNNWTFHGEDVDEISSEPMVENETVGETNLRLFVYDTYDQRDDIPNLLENMDEGEGTRGPNKEAQNFYSLLNDVDQELWPRCKLTKLSFLVLLFHIKSTNKWSNKSFDDLLEALLLAILSSANIHKSFQEAKKVIAKLGLGHVKIHSYPNHVNYFGKIRLMMIHAQSLELLGGKE